MVPEDVMVPDVGTSEDTVESRVALVAPLSPRGRGEADILEAAAAVTDGFREEPSWPSPLSPSWAVAFPTTPTASLKRVYKPLKPCCTRSPAVPLLSTAGRLPGGGAKSLKVVRTPVWLADVWWILSRAIASWALSTWDDAETEAREVRRARTVPGEGGDARAGVASASA